MSELGPTLTSSDRTATDELRRLLDERGVEWESGLPTETIVREPYNALYVERPDGRMHIYFRSYLTPEQAIAATLGDIDATGGRQSDADLAAENAKLRELADAVKEFVEDTHCEDCPCRRDCNDNNSIFCANDFSYHAFATMREL